MSRITRAFQENAGGERNGRNFQQPKRGPARPLLFGRAAVRRDAVLFGATECGGWRDRIG